MTKVIEKHVLTAIAKYFEDPSFCYELKQQRIIKIPISNLPPIVQVVDLTLEVFSYSEYVFYIMEEKPRFTARCQKLDLEIKFD
jgi:hypothetical protein